MTRIKGIVKANNPLHKNLNKHKLNRIFFIGINIILLIICSVFVLYLLSQSEEGNKQKIDSSSSYSQNPTVKICPITEPSSTYTQSGSKENETNEQTTERKLTNEQMLFINYIDQSLKAIQSVYSKVKININEQQELELDKTLKDLIKSRSIESYDYINEIQQEIKEYFPLVEHDNNEAHIKQSYFRALLKYFRVMKLSYDIFDFADEICSDLLKKESFDIILAVRLALEQLLFKPQLDLILKASKLYANTIHNLLFFNFEHFGFHRVLENVHVLFQFVVKQMIVNCGRKVKVNEESCKLQIPYLLENREAYRKFIILNFYFFYINLFKFDENFKPTEVRKHIKLAIDKMIGKKLENNVLISENNWTLGLLDKCRDVFIVLGKLSDYKIENVFESFDEINRPCLREINKYVLMISNSCLGRKLVKLGCGC